MSKQINMEFPLLNQSQISCQTALTRTGQINMNNNKPYRTKEQKKLAKHNSRKDGDGAFRSITPVSFHSSDKKRRRED